MTKPSKQVEDLLFTLTHKPIDRKERKVYRKELQAHKPEIDRVLKQMEKENPQLFQRYEKAYKTYLPTRSALSAKSFTFETEHMAAKWIGYAIVAIVLGLLVWAGWEFWTNKENIVKVMSQDYSEK